MPFDLVAPIRRGCARERGQVVSPLAAVPLLGQGIRHAHHVALPIGSLEVRDVELVALQAQDALARLAGEFAQVAWTSRGTSSQEWDADHRADMRDHDADAVCRDPHHSVERGVVPRSDAIASRSAFFLRPSAAGYLVRIVRPEGEARSRQAHLPTAMMMITVYRVAADPGGSAGDLGAGRTVRDGRGGTGRCRSVDGPESSTRPAPGSTPASRTAGDPIGLSSGAPRAR